MLLRINYFSNLHAQIVFLKNEEYNKIMAEQMEQDLEKEKILAEFREEVATFAAKETETRGTANFGYEGFNASELAEEDRLIWNKWKTMDELWKNYRKGEVIFDEVMKNENYISQSEFENYTAGIFDKDKNKQIVRGKFLDGVPKSRGIFNAFVANQLMKFFAQEDFEGIKKSKQK